MPEPVAVIIGAGDATGGAIAKRFAREGYTVCVTRRTEEALAPLVQEIEQAGGKARPFGCDARDEEQFDEFVARFETRLGEIAHPREGGGNAALIQTTMEQLARDGLIRSPPPDGRRRFSGSSDGPGSFPHPDRASGRWQGGLRPPPDAFDRRLRILDDSGQTLFGRPPVSENVGASGLSWPIERDGMLSLIHI